MIIKRQKELYVVQVSAQEINDLFSSVKSKLFALGAIIPEVPIMNYESFMAERKRIISLRDEFFEGIHHRDLHIR